MPESVKIKIPHEVAALIRNLHPLLKKRVRAGLEEICRDPYCGKTLKDELSGFRSFRIRRLRIVYEVSKTGRVSVVALGPRKRIYEETYRLLSRESPDNQ